MKQSIVKDKSYAFALKVVKLAQGLHKKNEYEIAKQILRSGTSIGANVEEALAGVSKPDFIYKMAISSKEARETDYWLRLIRDSDILSEKEIEPLIQEAQELIRILTAIVKSSQTKLNTKN